MTLNENLALEGVSFHHVAAGVEQIGVTAENPAVPEQHHAAALADAPIPQTYMDRVQPILHDAADQDVRPRGVHHSYAKVRHKASTRTDNCLTRRNSRLPGSSVFLVALQKLDRDALRAANEADAHAWADGKRLLGELDTLGPDLGGDRIDVLYRQSEVIEPLIGGHQRCVDAVAHRDRRDEDHGAAELDVDAPGAADDLTTENVFKPGRGRLRVGTAQMNMVPGHCRHLEVSNGWFGRRGAVFGEWTR